MAINNTLKECTILIPDGEHNYVRSILNCLSRAKGLRILVMSNKKNSPIKYSRFIYKYIYHPKTLEVAEWIENINKETLKNSIDVILPIYQTGMLNLLSHTELLSGAAKLSSFPSLKSYMIAKDKDLFAGHLKKDNIPIPLTTLATNNTITKEVIETFTFPLLAKPAKESGGGLGIVKIENKEELELFIKNTDDISNYIFQEYIEGYDIGCNVLCLNGEVLVHTTQRGFLWDNNSFAPQIGLTFVKDKALLKVVKSLMKSLMWSGVANIDARYDINTKQYKIIEINPRYWATIEGSLLSGINFPLLHCILSNGESIEVPQQTLIRYLTLRGLVKSITKRPIILLKPSFIWKNTPLKFLFKDPLAILGHYLWVIRNMLRKNLKKQL